MLNRINASTKPATDFSPKDDVHDHAPPPFSSKVTENPDRMRMLRSAARQMSPAGRAEARAQAEANAAQEKKNRQIAENLYPYLVLAKASSPGVVTIPYTDADGKTQVATIDNRSAILDVSIDGKPMFSIGPEGHFEMAKGFSASDKRIPKILESAFKESFNALGTPGGGFNKPVQATTAAVPAMAAMMLKSGPRQDIGSSPTVQP